MQDPGMKRWYAGPVPGVHSLEHAPSADNILGWILQVWTSWGEAVGKVDGWDFGDVVAANRDRFLIQLILAF